MPRIEPGELGLEASILTFELCCSNCNIVKLEKRNFDADRDNPERPSYATQLKAIMLSA